MIPSTDRSYLGSGSILFREYGASAPYVTLGNCSALTLSPQEDVKSLPDYTQPGGNKRNDVRRLTGVDGSLTFHDFGGRQFAFGLRSSSQDIEAGTATAEPVVAYKGGYTPLAKIAATITSVEPVGGGIPYEAGTDYDLVDGLLYVPEGSSIPAPTAGAANCEVDYTYSAQEKVEALISANKQYQLMFVGLNEAQSGKRHRVRLHKVSGGVLQEMAVLGEDFGAGQVNFALLSDSSITANDTSKYFVSDAEV